MSNVDQNTRADLKPWHRWLVVDVNWLGVPLARGEGFTQGFVTKRGATRRLDSGRRYGIERKVIRRVG